MVDSDDDLYMEDSPEANAEMGGQPSAAMPQVSEGKSVHLSIPFHVLTKFYMQSTNPASVE